MEGFRAPGAAAGGALHAMALRRARGLIPAPGKADRIPDSSMTKTGLFDFLQSHRLAVVATVTSDGAPEAAVMGFAVTPELDIVFDTVRSARKYANIMANPRVALVIGGEGEVTVQYEGIAGEPSGEARDRWKEVYFGTWPDGRDRQNWTGMTWFHVRPVWIRYSNFNDGSREIAEFAFPVGESAAAPAG
jgi:general stress protein 26